MVLVLLLLGAELTQFDLSGEELHQLRTKRWNFSSSTTQISDVSTDGEEGINGSGSSSEHAPHSLQPNNTSRLTVGDLYQQLSSAMEAGGPPCDRPLALRIPSESDKISFSLDSPFALETPSPSADSYSSSPWSHGKHFVDFWKEDEGHSVKVTANLVVPQQGLGRSASVDKERTRLREEEEEEGEEKGGGGTGDRGGAGSKSEDGLDDSLTVLGMVRKCGWEGLGKIMGWSISLDL